MTIDTAFSELYSQGYTGSINDRLFAFYRKYGDSRAQSLTDAEVSFLYARGIALGNVDDMWAEYLKDLPFYGDLQEKKKQFWTVHGLFKDFENDTIRTEQGYHLVQEDGAYLLVAQPRFLLEDDSALLLANKRIKLDNGSNLILEDGDALFLEDEDTLILN